MMLANATAEEGDDGICVYMCVSIYVCELNTEANHTKIKNHLNGCTGTAESSSGSS